MVSFSDLKSKLVFFCIIQYLIIIQNETIYFSFQFDIFKCGNPLEKLVKL